MSFVRGLGLALVVFAAQVAAQDDYPSQTVKVIIPSGVGGINDVVTRLMAPGLSKRLGRQVIVENRPGAGTTLGHNLVAKAKPDGHTLLMAVSTLAINPATYRTLPYEISDFAPITHAVSAAAMIVVQPSLKVKTVQEFLALARAKPDEIAYSSAGHGTNPHLAMELFVSMTGIRLRHIPYNGGPAALTALLGDQVSLMANSLSSVIQHVRAGRLTAIGVTSLTRIAAIPDVPTIAESGVPGYEVYQWSGLLAPAKTPAAIVARLHKESVEVLRSPEVSGPLINDGVVIVASTPQEFASFIDTETAKWAKVVKTAGIKPE